MSPRKPTNGIKKSAPASSGKTHKQSSRCKKHNGIRATPAAIAAAAKNCGFLLSINLPYAVEFLKANRTPKTIEEILDHLALQQPEGKRRMAFELYLRMQSCILFQPKSKSKRRTGTYEFQAKLTEVDNEETLLEYLQDKPDASYTLVKDIKNSWPEFEPTIDKLEREQKILVYRTKRHNEAKSIWLDNPSLHHEVDTQFQDMWFQEKLPSADDMPRLLNQQGQKAMSVPTKNTSHNLEAPPKKARASRRTST